MMCDPNIKQVFPNSCAIKCQQIILRDYGIDVSENELMDIAIQYGWFNYALGMYMHDNGKLLGCFGIGYHHLQHSTVEDIAWELQQGHRVMVNVNADKLHEGPEVSFRHNEASHAVLITMVSKGDGCLFFTDPMTGNIDEPCPIEWFQNAWRDSVCYMLATDCPARFHYDPTTQSMKEILT